MSSTKPRRYSCSSFNPNGVAEDPTRCIESVSHTRTFRTHQCSRKRGFGRDGLYCKQHAYAHPAKIEVIPSLPKQLIEQKFVPRADPVKAIERAAERYRRKRETSKCGVDYESGFDNGFIAGLKQAILIIRSGK